MCWWVHHGLVQFPWVTVRHWEIGQCSIEDSMPLYLWAQQADGARRDFLRGASERTVGGEMVEDDQL